jgi:glucose/mannose transport system permease protein
MEPSIVAAASSSRAGVERAKRAGAEHWLPKLVVAPTFLIALVFFYGFILWNAYLSMTPSRLLPNYEFIGLLQYRNLFDNERCWVAMRNLAVFGTLFIAISIAIGVFLAILLDQRIRAEGFIRSVYLYPMALSSIVAGTAWRWMLNPGLGLEKLMHDWGFAGFTFDWLINPERAIYAVVIAAVWQSSGFVMALFLAGLRGIDDSIIKAAQVDGASLPRIYARIILPALRPVFFAALMILAHIAIKSFDLVMAMTAGGPGFSSDLPATFMYAFAFTRSQIGLGAASAVVMLTTVVAVMVPFVYSELRGPRRG